jgi:hypothetical protein
MIHCEAALQNQMSAVCLSINMPVPVPVSVLTIDTNSQKVSIVRTDTWMVENRAKTVCKRCKINRLRKSFDNPERVEYQMLTKQIQPFQGCHFSVFSPRVARSPACATLRRGKSQPWAESFNPVGIGKANDKAFNITCYL